MKRLILILAILAAHAQADAAWVHFPAAESTDGYASLDDSPAVDRTAVGTLVQWCQFTPTKRCTREFAFINAPDCKQGFGYIRYRDFDGKATGARTAFVLNNAATIGDNMAEYLCDAFKARTTTARGL